MTNVKGGADEMDASRSPSHHGAATGGGVAKAEMGRGRAASESDDEGDLSLPASAADVAAVRRAHPPTYL